MKKGKELIGCGSIFLLGVLCGVASLILEEKGIINPATTFEAIVVIFISFLLHIIIHELGHLEFGLISGYEFSSFRIGSLTWIKEDGKVKLKKYSLKGTLGQCLMIPPAVEGYNYPVILYNLGGILMNLIVSVIMLIPGILWKSGALMLFIFVGVFFVLTNGIPTKSNGVPNDGMNVKCLRNDPLARQTFDFQLRSNALLMKGGRLKDMPAEWFEMPENSDLTNMNTGTMLSMQIARLMDACEFAQAKEKIQWTLDNATGIMGLHKNELKCELIFCHIMLGEYEEAEKIYEYEMKKYINETAVYPSRKRLMYAYYLLVEKDEEKAEKELKQFNVLKKNYPYKGDLESEEELIEKISNCCS